MSDPEQRWGILGGTFDPPHLAHLALAVAARDRLRLDTVLFIPAGDPWRKTDRAITLGIHRVAMVRAAVEDLPWAEVSSIEVERDGPTYTLETVEALAVRGGAWWFITGEDALHDLPHWYRPERLIEAVRLAVARRDSRAGPTSVERPLITPELRAALPGIDTRVDEVPMPRLDISATESRARVRAGQPTDGLLPDAVRAYIDQHDLYR